MHSFKSIGEWRNVLNASKDEARRIMDEAEKIDEEENRHYGEGLRGDELPAELQKAEDRIKRIEELLGRAKELGDRNLLLGAP